MSSSPPDKITGACKSGQCSHDPAHMKAVRDLSRTNRCEHFDTIRKVDPQTDGCAECLAEGRAWTELRVCLTCGHVGCCEDSPGRHALSHYETTGHPMIVSYERLDTWGWCYVHHRYFDPMPQPLPQRPYEWQRWFGKLFGRKATAA